MRLEERQQRIVSFKAGEALVEAMEGIPNRSAFIRAAILAALDSGCPLCRGTGVLSPNQQRHWLDFTQNHSMITCSDCNERRLVCVADGR